MKIQVKRAYDGASASDGYRILVDRLWPRGVKKEDADIDIWLKDVAPSTELRQWFGHDPEKYREFRERYRAELEENDAFAQLKLLVAKHENITLVYSAKDEEHNQARVLVELLLE